EANRIGKCEIERGPSGRVERLETRALRGGERATKRAAAELRDELIGARTLARSGVAGQKGTELGNGRRRQRLGRRAQKRGVLNREVAGASKSKGRVAIAGKLVGGLRGIA